MQLFVIAQVEYVITHPRIREDAPASSLQGLQGSDNFTSPAIVIPVQTGIQFFKINTSGSPHSRG
jgi:hypothetical protein